MTTNNYINTGSVTSRVYSVTPELNDNLAQGAIYQADLKTQGAPVGNALGYYKSSLTTFGTPDAIFSYPLAAPRTGPLLRQIQGSDGHRYLLSRFDGILFANANPATNPLASPATYCYPVASTDGVNPVVIGCRLAVDSSNGTYTTYPIYPGVLTSVSPFTYLIVGVSDGTTDSIAQATPSINTFGGFCLYLGNNNLPVPPPQPQNPGSNPTTYGVFNVYSTPATFIVPQDFVKGNPNVPAYGKPSTVGTVTNYYYNITVGDYVWLQVGATPGSVSSPVSSPAVTSKAK